MALKEDSDIVRIHKGPVKGFTDFYDNYKSIAPWKKRKLIRWFLTILVLSLVFLAVACNTMLQDRLDEEQHWQSHSIGNTEAIATADELAAENNATRVKVGTYIENVKEISLKNSSFTQTMLVWFKWKGDDKLDMANNFRIYNGTIASQQLVTDKLVKDEHYQLVRLNVTVSRAFRTTRFPLENHFMHTYVESNYTAERMIFEPCGDDEAIGESTISGYTQARHNTVVTAYTYDSTHGDPSVNQVTTSEYLTNVEVKRDGWGLFLKCFIAMYGTSIWCLIALFMCGHHHIDPLSMIPAALFGTVSNIMVGAALVPDALNVGLLEFVNIWGIATVLACALIVISCNELRRDHVTLVDGTTRNGAVGAGVFGRVLFIEVFIIAVAGNVIMPLFASFIS